MSEEIKDLFQRENIKTMKKDLRRFAESETQAKKEGVLSAKKEGAIIRPVSAAHIDQTPAVASPAPAPAAGSAVPTAPRPANVVAARLAEEKETQQLSDRFTKIGEDQEEKNQILRAQEETLIERNKAAGQEENAPTIVASAPRPTVRVPVPASLPSRPTPPLPPRKTIADLSSLTDAPKPTENKNIGLRTPQSPQADKDRYKENIDEKTEKKPAFGQFSRTLNPQPGLQTRTNIQRTQPSPLPKPTFAPIRKPETPVADLSRPQPPKTGLKPEEAPLTRIPAGQPNIQRNQPIPARPQPTPTVAKTEPAPVAAPPKENPVEMAKALEERSLTIEKDLARISQEKAPVNSRYEEISKEIKKITDTQLQAITAKEAEISKKVLQLEEKQKSAVSPEEKRTIEISRHEAEAQLEETEGQRYVTEDSIKTLDIQLNECKAIQDRLGETEKKLLAEKESLSSKKEMIDLSKKNGELKTEHDSLNEKLSSLRGSLSSILKEKDDLEAQLAPIAQRERELDPKIQAIESQESWTKDQMELREVEAQRKALSLQRREAEKERWNIEDKKKELTLKEGEIKTEYQKNSKRLEEIKRDLKLINDRLSQING